MVPRPRTRPQSLLQAVSRPTCLSSQPVQHHSRSRKLHSVPSLNSEKDSIFAKYGVPGLFSKPTYEETWLQYQAALCKTVNDQVRGTTDENSSMKRLHETTSRQRSKAALYNAAAQAHHNHFFFKSLSHKAHPDPPTELFQRQIEEWFESLSHLGEEIIDNALSMFGNGYVWLLAENDGKKTLRILCTYNAGSPFPEAHTRQQAMVGAGATSPDGTTDTRLLRVTNQAGAFGGSTIGGQATHFTGAFVGTPILCLKMWEHQYMRDYGLAGKEAYVANWWNRIDWTEVHKRWNDMPDDSPTDRFSRRVHAGFERGP